MIGAMATTETLPDYLTVGEVAAILRVQPATVRRWLRAGQLEGFQIGHTWRIVNPSAAAPPDANPDADKTAA